MLWGTMVSRLIDSAGGQDLELERRRDSREDRTPICTVAEEGSPFCKPLGKLPKHGVAKDVKCCSSSV